MILKKKYFNTREEQQIAPDNNLLKGKTKILQFSFFLHNYKSSTIRLYTENHPISGLKSLGYLHDITKQSTLEKVQYYLFC